MPKVSLSKFAAARRPFVHCKTCNLPKRVLQEVNAGLKHGEYTTTVSEWLQKTHGIAITDESIRRHRRSCVNVES